MIRKGIEVFDNLRRCTRRPTGIWVIDMPPGMHDRVARLEQRLPCIGGHVQAELLRKLQAPAQHAIFVQELLHLVRRVAAEQMARETRLCAPAPAHAGYSYAFAQTSRIVTERCSSTVTM